MGEGQEHGQPLYVEQGAEELVTLIEIMRTARIPDAKAQKAARRKRSQTTIDEMIRTGSSYGRAQGGSLSFLANDDAQEFIKRISNNLQENVKIVRLSFLEYVEFGEIPAPYYAWRICVILRKVKLQDLEREFLSVWCLHFAGSHSGSRYADLVARAEKVGAI